MNSPIGKSNFYVYLHENCPFLLFEDFKISPWRWKSFLFHAMFVPKLFLTCKLNYRLVCDMPRVCYCSAFEDHGKKLCSFILSLKTVFNTIFSHFLFLFKSHFVKLDNVSGAYFFPILNYGAKVPFEGPFLSLFPVKPFVEEKGHKHVDFQLFRTKILLERTWK